MELNNNGVLLKGIIDRAVDMIQVFEAIRDEQNEIVDFKCILNNKASEKIYGEIIGKSLSTLEPGLVAGFFDTFKKVVQSGEPNQRVAHYIHEQFEGWFHYTSIKEGDGVAITTKDITQERRTDDQLRTTRDSLQAILDGSLHFIQAFKAVRDDAGKIVDFTWIFTNNIWIKHYGNVIGKRLLQQNPAVIETGLFDQFVQVTETGISISQDHYYAHEQFQEQWFHQTLVKMGDGFVMNTEDITERKKAENEIHRLKDEIVQRSEDKYRTLFNTIDKSLAVLEVIYDDSGKPTGMSWLEANPAFEILTGSQNVAGKLYSGFVSSENYWLQTYDLVVKTGEPIRYEHFHEDTKRWYQTHMSRVGDPESRVLVAILEDITERKDEEQRQAYLLKLSDALRSISDPEGIENAVTAEALSFFKSDRCYYSTITEGSAIICHDACRNDFHSLKGTYLLSKFELYYMVLETGLPFAVNDVHNSKFINDDFLSLLLSVDIQAFVNVPVVKAGKVVGIFTLAQSEPKTWTDAEIALAAETAERTWSAMEQAKAERAIQKSEEQFRLFITASSNLAYKMSADWKNMYTLMGKDILANTDDATGEWMEKYIPEYERPLVTETIHQAIETKSTFELEHRVFRVEGTVGWVLSSAVPVLDEEGTIKEWVGVGIDITLRKNAEIMLQRFNERLETEVIDRTIELQKSRDQLQSILDTTLVQMSILEAVRDDQNQITDLKIKAVNRELEKETGRVDLVGKFYAQEYPGIRPSGLFDLIVEAIETGMSQSTEYFYTHEGFQKWFSSVFVKLGDGVVATNMDITGQKQAEEARLKNYVLLQQSEDIASMGTWDFDLLTKSFTWSDGMYRLFDLEKGLEVKPDIYIKYATENSRVAAERVVKHIENGDADFEETLEISISGKIKVLHLKASVVRNNEGNTERVLGVDLDISAMRRAEEKIRQIEAEQKIEIFRVSLSALEEERYRISESLHNGIGQILFAIKINLNGLRQEMPLADFKESKTYVNELLSDVIKDTRRISHDLMPTTLEEFGLKSAIDDICSQLSDGTKFKCHINGLPGRMEKYLELAVYRTTQELVTNVVKHAKATECRVSIDIGQQDIRIRVSDNGQGMEAAKTRKPGIGLNAIRSKTKLLNGDVRVDSVPGKGTNVEVIIPRAQTIKTNM